MPPPLAPGFLANRTDVAKAEGAACDWGVELPCKQEGVRIVTRWSKFADVSVDGRFAQDAPPPYPNSLLATSVSHKYPAQAALHGPHCWNLLRGDVFHLLCGRPPHDV